MLTQLLVKLVLITVPIATFPLILFVLLVTLDGVNLDKTNNNSYVWDADPTVKLAPWMLMKKPLALNVSLITIWMPVTNALNPTAKEMDSKLMERNVLDVPINSN